VLEGGIEIEGQREGYREGSTERSREKGFLLTLREGRAERRTGGGGRERETEQKEQRTERNLCRDRC